MLGKLFGSISLMALGLWFIGSAQAAPMTFTDLIKPDPPIYMSGRNDSKILTITHDITDLVSGAFIPGFHILSQGTLKVTFDDDTTGTEVDTKELMQVTVGGTTYGPVDVDHMTMFVISLNSTALADLNLDGRISVRMEVANRNGDLNFISSDLVANTAALPEPSTLILLGSGLAGVVGFGFTRRKHEEENKTASLTS